MFRSGMHWKTGSSILDREGSSTNFPVQWDEIRSMLGIQYCIRLNSQFTSESKLFCWNWTALLDNKHNVLADCVRIYAVGQTSGVLMYQKLDSLHWFSQRRSPTPHFWGCAPRRAITPKFEHSRDLCTVHLPRKFRRPMFTRRKLSCWQTNKQTLLKTSNALRYAMTLGHTPHNKWGYIIPWLFDSSVLCCLGCLGDFQCCICRLKVKLLHRLSFYPDLGMDTLARVSFVYFNFFIHYSWITICDARSYLFTVSVGYCLCVPHVGSGAVRIGPTLFPDRRS